MREQILPREALWSNTYASDVSATHQQHISNTLATHQQHISNTLATHQQHISNTLATPASRSVVVKHVCVRRCHKSHIHVHLPQVSKETYYMGQKRPTVCGLFIHVHLRQCAHHQAPAHGRLKSASEAGVRRISNTLAPHQQHISTTLATHQQHMCTTLATHQQHLKSDREAGVKVRPPLRGIPFVHLHQYIGQPVPFERTQKRALSRHESDQRLHRPLCACRTREEGCFLQPCCPDHVQRIIQHVILYIQFVSWLEFVGATCSASFNT